LHGSGQPAVIDGPGGTGSSRTGQTAPAQPPGAAGLSGPWVALLPAAVTLLAGLYRISGPSFSKDEAATLAAVHRSFPQLIRMLGSVDVVHGAYYVLIWAVVRLAGSSSELTVRLPSALAMAAAAGVVALLGRRLVSGWAGLAAGLLFAILPSVSAYAQDAREGAILAALAATASYCLLRAADAGRSRRRWLAGYGVTLALLGFGNLFALLLVAAHAITLLAWGSGRRDRGLLRGWLIAVAAAAVAVSPVAVVGYSQLHQIRWIQPPDLTDVVSVQRLLGRTSLLIATVVVVAAAAGYCAARRVPLGRYWPGRLVALCLPWLILPPVILLTASLIQPVYTFRYIVFCIPAAALLIAPALAALGGYAGPAALITLLVIGLPSQSFERSAVGHGINIRKLDQIVARHHQPGDALLNVSARRGPQKGTGECTLEAAYPYGLARLRNISTGLSPQQSGTLGGTYASTQVIRERAATVRRIWVVEWTSPQRVVVLDGLGFRLVHRWDIQGLWLRLYVRGARR